MPVRHPVGRIPPEPLDAVTLDDPQPSMIVDCHTHTWESPEALGRAVSLSRGTTSGGGEEPVAAGAARHLAASEPVDWAFVLGFTSHYLGAQIANDHVAAFVRSHPERLIGIACVDPSKPKEALDEVQRARRELDMRGVAVAPAAQDFHPTNSQAMLVYAEAATLSMPVIFHNGLEVTSSTKLEYAQPVLLDEIARELPNLKIVVSHLGQPWIHETLALLAKHPNVYADISDLLASPWRSYQALLGAHELGVMRKLLFASGFPRMRASHCIEALYASITSPRVRACPSYRENSSAASWSGIP